MKSMDRAKVAKIIGFWLLPRVIQVFSAFMPNECVGNHLFVCRTIGMAAQNPP